MISGRSILLCTALWVALHLALMAVTLGDSSRPALSLLAAVVVVAATAAVARPLVGGERGLPLPVALAIGAAVPAAAALVTPFLGPDAVLGYANWWPGCVGPLLTALVLRRHAWVAIVASALAGAVLGASLHAVLPPEESRAEALSALSTHLVLWPAAGIALALLFRRADRTVDLLSTSVQDARARAEGAGVLGETPARLLDLAGPVLQAISRGEPVGPDDAERTRRLETGLRDELRAGPLLDDDARTHITRLRDRGWSVDVDHHGGSDGDGGRDAEVSRAVALGVLAACARSSATGGTLALLVPHGSSVLVSVALGDAPGQVADVEQVVRAAAVGRPVEIDLDGDDLWLAVVDDAA